MQDTAWQVAREQQQFVYWRRILLSRVAFCVRNLVCGFGCCPCPQPPRNPRPKTSSLVSGSLNLFFLHLKRERCTMLIDLVMFIPPFLLRAPELGDISERTLKVRKAIRITCLKWKSKIENQKSKIKNAKTALHSLIPYQFLKVTAYNYRAFPTNNSSPIFLATFNFLDSQFSQLLTFTTLELLKKKKKIYKKGVLWLFF